jgi:hypothetical protein
MTIVQDPILLGVGGVGYLRIIHRTAEQSVRPLSKVATVDAGRLPRACRAQWLDDNVLDLPCIAQRAFHRLGWLTARQLQH